MANTDKNIGIGTSRRDTIAVSCVGLVINLCIISPQLREINKKLICDWILSHCTYHLQKDVCYMQLTV